MFVYRCKIELTEKTSICLKRRSSIVTLGLQLVIIRYSLLAIYKMLVLSRLQQLAFQHFIPTCCNCMDLYNN